MRSIVKDHPLGFDHPRPACLFFLGVEVGVEARRFACRSVLDLYERKTIRSRKAPRCSMGRKVLLSARPKRPRTVILPNPSAKTAGFVHSVDETWDPTVRECWHHKMGSNPEE